MVLVLVAEGGLFLPTPPLSIFGGYSLDACLLKRDQQ